VKEEEVNTKTFHNQLVSFNTHDHLDESDEEEGDGEEDDEEEEH
jgi:hypothetical protein